VKKRHYWAVRRPGEFGIRPADPPGPPARKDDRLFLHFIDFIEAQRQAVQYAGAFALLAVIFFVDVVTGHQLSISIFYLMPISMLAWHRGTRAGILAAIVCTGALLAADLLSGRVYPHPAILYWNGLVPLGFFVVVAAMLAQLRQGVNLQQRLARTDGLTGVANSRWFLEVAAAEVARQQRYGQPVSIAFVDCDNFKQVNDVHGHAVGDDLLRRIGACMVQTLRSVDVVARLGGDEFAILMPETDADAAHVVCGKVRDALNAIVEQYGVTISSGLVTYLVPPANVKEMLHSADLAMYDAKKTGKNSSRHRVIDGALAEGTNF
jgi:diguanylate cyclase (GGDEF)-like protein